MKRGRFVPKDILAPVLQAYRELSTAGFKGKVLEMDRLTRAAVMATCALEAKKFEGRAKLITQAQYIELMAVGHIIAETLQ